MVIDIKFQFVCSRQCKPLLYQGAIHQVTIQSFALRAVSLERKHLQPWILLVSWAFKT